MGQMLTRSALKVWRLNVERDISNSICLKFGVANIIVPLGHGTAACMTLRSFFECAKLGPLHDEECNATYDRLQHIGKHIVVPSAPLGGNILCVSATLLHMSHSSQGQVTIKMLVCGIMVIHTRSICGSS